MVGYARRIEKSEPLHRAEAGCEGRIEAFPTNAGYGPTTGRRRRDSIGLLNRVVADLRTGSWDLLLRGWRCNYAVNMCGESINWFAHDVDTSVVAGGRSPHYTWRVRSCPSSRRFVNQVEKVGGDSRTGIHERRVTRMSQLDSLVTQL